MNIKINTQKVEIQEDMSILEAANQCGIKIPTLCNHPDFCVAGNCRICLVEVKGSKTLQAACATPVEDGMEITTNSIKVRNARRTILELLLSEHNSNCTYCYKNGSCELQSLTAQYKITNNDFISLLDYKGLTIDNYSPSIEKDDSKCIRCIRCVRTCDQLQHVGALSALFKGKDMKIGTFDEMPLSQVVCTNCGQCILHCPTGALTEKSDTNKVWDAIFDPHKHVVVQTAPAVRIGIGEALGYDAGSRLTGKLVSALKQIGFDSVLDTNFTADLTIIEEGNELLSRLKSHIKEKNTKTALPLITSCSPGWIKFAEHRYTEYLPNLSTCKSPQQMFGALAKTYYAQKRNINPRNIVSVSVMPCTAKKFEASRPEMNASGFRDVDYVLTTRELASMIEQAGINFAQLEESIYDSIMGKSTGAGMIFGATGGVMEAALRTAYEFITGQEVPFKDLNITPVRGLEGVKEASIPISGCLPEWRFLEGINLKLAIAHGLKNANRLMTAVQKREKKYHFIEIMACPGGCLGGGGQPIPVNSEIRQKRMEAVYQEDMGLKIRKSHENPDVIAVYNEFLKEPLGEKSHELLHTHYCKRDAY